MREARVCYDHLAGEKAVAVLDASYRLGLLNDGDMPELTAEGHDYFTCMGIDVDTLERGKRPLCRHCLDWSERKNHLGGALGAALLQKFLKDGWVRRQQGRVISFTPTGMQAFAKVFPAE